tara:strand:- start:81 stop:893 length:813 start_codon:yes stop_codon:yes gene_type:complete
MPKYPEFNNKPLKGVNEEDWGKMTVGYFNRIDAHYARTDYLLFKPELINELAKPFTNPQQMKDFVGENEIQIRQAGAYIMGHKVERPEWFEDINFQTPEECIKEAKKYNTKWVEIPYYLRQKLNRHFNSKELRTLLPNIQWERKYRNDDDFVKLLSKFKKANDMRNSSIKNKNLLSIIIADKGVNYPKAYALAENMKKGHTPDTRTERGKYGQRVAGVAQYDLEGNLLKLWNSYNELLEAGFKRGSINGAIRGTDGHNKHKGCIWKYIDN